MSAPTPAPADRWRAFAVCLGAGFVTLLDVSIVNVALPSIETSLGAGPSDLQWIVAGYTLAFGLALVPAGRFGDSLGRRPVFVAGLTAFVLASAACGLATSAEMLAVTRVIQGMSAGVLNPQIVGLIQQLFSGHERARAFGLFGATIGISTAVGPLVGGLLLTAFGTGDGWRAVFLVNVPIAAVLIPMALRELPRPEPRPRAAGRSAPRPRGIRRLPYLDGVGLALMAASVLAVMLPFITASETAHAPWWLVGAGAGVLGVFVAWERRTERAGRRPVLASALLRTPSFTFGAAVGTAYFAGFTGIFLAATLYLQTGLGLSPLLAGLAQVPFALLGAASSAATGRLLPKFGRWTVVGGIVVMATGLTGVAIAAPVLDGAAAAWTVTGLLAFAGLGSGAVISPNQALTLHDVPVSQGSTAGGLLQTTQRIGAAVGVAVVTAVFFQALAGSRPHDTAGGYGPALSAGLRVTLAVLGVALLLAVLDAWRRHSRPEQG